MLKIRAVSVLVMCLIWLCSLAAKPGRLPNESPSPLPGYTDINALKSRIAKSGPHRIEGIWQIPNTGATIAIERVQDRSRLSGTTVYNMTVIRSDNRTIRPGTLMGVISPSAKSEVFDAMIYSSTGKKSTLTSPKRFTLTLSEKETRLVFSPVKSKYSVNLWRMLPYMFRYAVRKNERTGEAPIGCLKLFPTPAIPTEPRFL